MAFKTRDVDDPDVPPVPVLCDVATAMLPVSMRNSVGPLPASYRVEGATKLGCCVTVCAIAGAASTIAAATRSKERKFF